MGTGESGNYYTSGGSDQIHHPALIHSIEGEFAHDQGTGRPARLRAGGHGQANIDLLVILGIEYNIEKTWPNGVRVGNVPSHKVKFKRGGTCQAWFPKEWTTRDIVHAAEHIVSLKRNEHTLDGVTMWGIYKGVRVGVIKTAGRIATVFPDWDQNDVTGRRG